MNTKQTKAILQAVHTLYKSGGNLTKRPVMTNCKVTRNTIEYTNLTTGLIVNTIEQPYITEPILIPITQVLNYTKKTKSPEFTIIPDGRTAVLQGAKSKLKVPMFGVVGLKGCTYPEIPAQPTTPEPRFIIDGTKLQDCITRCLFAMDTDDKRALDCLLMEKRGDSLTMVSTNQVCVRTANMDVVSGTSLDFRVNITVDTIALLKVLHAADKSIRWEVYSENEGKSIIFKSREYTVVARCNQMRFPHYEECVREYGSKPGATATKEEWQGALGELDCVLCENSRHAAMTPGQIKACTPLGEMEIDFNTGVFDGTVGIHPAMIAAYIKTLEKGAEVRMVVSGPRKPIAFLDDNGMFFCSPVAV